MLPRVLLQPVGEDNWQDIIHLQLAQGQDACVASAAETLAESGVFPYYVNRAILFGDKVVGLMQYHPMAPEGTAAEYFISQFMVDAAYQGQGIGSKALAQLLDELSGKSDCEVISICHVHGHQRMARLFTRFGFTKISQSDVDAEVYERRIREAVPQSITLQPVTRHNYEAISDLEVFDHQDDYVASATWSLLEASHNPAYTCRGIYHGDQLVGYFMWVQATPAKVSIWRFMIDKSQQQRGFGRWALQCAIDEIAALPWVEDIEICYQPDNPVAGPFYAGFGFVETGMDEDDDDMLAIMRVRKVRSAVDAA